MNMKKFIRHWPNNNQILALTTTKICGFVKADYNSNILEEIGIDKENMVFASQIHGNKVQLVGNQNLKQTIKNVDGLLTKDKNVYLTIRTADCVPIFFYEAKSKIVGLAHSGWKGTYKNIAREMIKNIAKAGGRTENILIQIGPHICASCYEVKNDVLSCFAKDLTKSNKRGNKSYLNLAGIICDQLAYENIDRENINISNYCTFHDKEYFHSYRRDFKNNQQYMEMLSIISL